MARIRTIKPNFFKHEELSKLDAETQLLAAGLLCYADDVGYFNANPKLVQAEIFPLRELSRNVQGMLDDLAKIGYIRLGKCKDGRNYGHIVEFLTHQKVSHPQPSSIQKLEVSWNVHGTFSEHSSLNRIDLDGIESKKPSAKNAEPDPRHAPIRDYIKHCITFATKLDPAPWSGRDAKALQRELTNNPSWDVETFKRLIRDRFRSDVPRGDPAYKWLPSISKYANGPLDRFDKPQEASDGQDQRAGITGTSEQAKRNQRNTDKLARILLPGISRDAPVSGVECPVRTIGERDRVLEAPGIPIPRGTS